jgi:ABC-type uncharacterized transport system ATPase subunit
MEDGLISEFTVADNLVLNSYWRTPFASGMRLDGDAIVANAESLVTEFDIRTPSIFNPVGNLSADQPHRRRPADARARRRLHRVHPSADRGQA